MSAVGGQLLVAVGDIHGRFERVDGWLRELQQAHGRDIDVAIGVGDLETFTDSDAKLRKRSKREGPAEFGPYARGERRLPCPLFFIGGNNEDFAALAEMPDGGELAPGVRYLGRAGATELGGVKTAFLSGIFGPSSFDQPLLPPRTLELARRAGHFRKSELERVAAAGPVELLLVHDWPRGLLHRNVAGAPTNPPGFWGNTQAAELADALQPAWMLCGHQHRAWAASLGPRPTHVACLDEAENPGGALVWLEVDGGVITRVGWGTSTAAAWETGQPWDWKNLPR